MKLLKYILMVFLLTSCQLSFQPVSMKIIHLDCGRKYFSEKCIKDFIDEVSENQLTYIELAIGNDGCRFLLDDMSFESNGNEYTDSMIRKGIHDGNELYADFEIDELTEKEMDEIIEYAHSKNIDIIPLINSPGHMDSILYCAKDCGIENSSFDGSVRTIDVTNKEVVAFTQSLLEKYIQYFSSRGCSYFSIGADEYGNDIYPKGKMGFGQLIRTHTYNYFVDYVNECASLVKKYNMIPMAFNDGIYFENNREYGEFDTDILICYWENGWFGYNPCSVKNLKKYGFEIINTDSDYYWVLGGSNRQCSPFKMSQFNIHRFKGGRIDPIGAMFCIWCDEPYALSEQEVFEKTKEVIQVYGDVLTN